MVEGAIKALKNSIFSIFTTTETENTFKFLQKAKEQFCLTVIFINSVSILEFCITEKDTENDSDSFTDTIIIWWILSRNN